MSSARSGRAQDQDSQRGRSYLRDNVLVRHGSTAEHAEHGLQAHAGPTDLDVAMFHRDAGGVGALGREEGLEGVFLIRFLLPQHSGSGYLGGTNSCQVAASESTYPSLAVHTHF